MSSPATGVKHSGALLAVGLCFVPEERSGEPRDTFTGSGTISAVVWWPQRDSNPCFSLERAVS